MVESFSQRSTTEKQKRKTQIDQCRNSELGSQSTIEEQLMTRVQQVFEIELTVFGHRMKSYRHDDHIDLKSLGPAHSVLSRSASIILWPVIPFLEGKHPQGFSPSSFQFPFSAVQSVASSLPFSLLSLSSYAPFQPFPSPRHPSLSVYSPYLD